MDGWQRSQYAQRIADNIVQHGEATGHAHRIEAGEVWQERGEMVVVAGPSTVLTHNEHDTITIPEGTYRVLRQREFTPEGERVVRD